MSSVSKGFAVDTLFNHEPSGNLLNQSQGSVSQPGLTTQPDNAVIPLNGHQHFCVLVSGSGDFTYQWLSNGIPISGATNDFFAPPRVTVPSNLVSNGDFEAIWIDSSYVPVLPATNLGGWTVESGAIDLVNFFWSAASGRQSLDLSGGSAGAIYQDLATVPGQQYLLRFAVAGNPNCLPFIKTNEVWWNGTLLDSVAFDITGRSTTSMGWTNREYLVTATSTNTRLRFASRVDGACGPALDSVSLLPVLPPVPAYSVIISNAQGSVTSATMRAEFDLDRNGLPDTWERNYFGFPHTQTSASDFDSDGVSNIDEYREGTNPTDATSLRPRLIVTGTARGSILISPRKTSYDLNEVVQVTARPDDGEPFDGWTGDLSGDNPVIPLVMDRTKSISATFGLPILTNGASLLGTIVPGGTNLYAFRAVAGDGFVLEIGETSEVDSSFYPELALSGPNGESLGSAGGSAGYFLTGRLTNAGLFTVSARSQFPSGGGTFRLTLAKAPGGSIVPAGDEGGVVLNGATAAGSLTPGDIDIWNFTADAGQRVVLRLGATVQGNGSPGFALFAPDGALLTQALQPAADSYFEFVATNAGTFGVMVYGNSSGGGGSYRLSLVEVPGILTTTPGDEGGLLAANMTIDGVTDVGDEDAWTLTAFAGNELTLHLQQLSSGTGQYYPWARLYYPVGVLVATTAAGPLATLTYQPTNSGNYTLILGSQFLGHFGTYRLSGNGFSPGLKLTPPTLSGTNLEVTAHGGVPGRLFVVSASTNLAPAPVWTPILSNYFDASGAFSLTNLYRPNERERYFRVTVP